MTDSEHGHEATATTRRQRRGVGNYCEYCGRKRSDVEPATTDTAVGARLRTFCDADCERAWNIDAGDSHTHG
jgi:hypothetical protein